jgi:hypothetical protein
MFNDHCPPSRLHYLIWHTPVSAFVFWGLIGFVVGVVVRWLSGS